MRTVASISTKRFVNRDATRIFYRDKHGIVQSALYATIDHIIPVAAGGGKNEGNLTLACAPCNTAKADTPVHKFAPATRKKAARRVQELASMPS